MEQSNVMAELITSLQSVTKAIEESLLSAASPFRRMVDKTEEKAQEKKDQSVAVISNELIDLAAPPLGVAPRVGETGGAMREAPPSFWSTRKCCGSPETLERRVQIGNPR